MAHDRSSVMETLKRSWPNVHIAPAETFSESYEGSGAIWTGFGETGHADIDVPEALWDPGLLNYLRSVRWAGEWYDPGTLMLYPEGGDE